jgi:hypothetical protein
MEEQRAVLEHQLAQESGCGLRRLDAQDGSAHFHPLIQKNPIGFGS